MKTKGLKIKNIINKTPVIIITLIILAIGIGVVSLYFATGDYSLEMFYSYFTIPIIAGLNILPVILLIMLLFFITAKVWLSFLLTSLIVLVPSVVNYYKILIRNDPLIMRDLSLLSESYNMAGEFLLKFNWQIIITIITIVIITLVTKKILRTQIDKITRLVATLILVIFSWVSFSNLYMNKDVYQSIENFDLINRWAQTQSYISKGFIYPFIHSLTSAFDQKPPNYSDTLAIEILDDYEDDDIPKDKKVDIIAVMLEGYNDFSTFEEVEFLIDVYKPWHNLIKESVSGELVNNIFAGETVDTEWGFLTGFSNFHQFRTMTNSYVHYLSDQGYIVEGSHPCYQWFYNRENINNYLGFDNYYFYENHYAKLANNTIARDKILFPEIIEFYENSKQNDSPYFSFNVTYQNHGPYPNTHTGEIKYIEDDGLSTESYNILNNYLAGIYDTNKEVDKFIDYFRDKEATVIILFGDHNPWLGDNNKVYHELGINIDLDTEEGFFNYYNTPYLIWSNEKAKEVLENNFIGQGETIGPYFLMNEFFNLAGYEGNSFMKLSNEIKHFTNIIHTDGYFLVDDNLTRELDEEANEALERFSVAQYYLRNNFLE